MTDSIAYGGLKYPKRRATYRVTDIDGDGYGGGGWFGAGAGAAVTTLLDVDFTGFTEGFHNSGSFQAQTFTAPVKANLTLKRFYDPASSNYEGSRGETVQTSESTLLRSALSPQIDVACVGNRTSTSSKRGLVIQHNVVQQIGEVGDMGSDAVRNLTSHWQYVPGPVPAPATLTANYADAPDGSGTGCTRVNCASAGVGPYRAWLSDRTFAYCFSSWQKSLFGTKMLEVQNSAVSITQVTTSVVAGWDRFYVANGVTARRYFVSNDGRDWVASGGLAAAAHDLLIDYTQLEVGDFMTEVIPTAFSVRRSEELDYAAASTLVATNGQFKMYARLTPKFASTMVIRWAAVTSSDGTTAVGWYLFSWGATAQNYAYIKSSDKKVYVKIANGSEYVSTNAIAFAQYDEVELYIAVGSNVASILKYRINAGAWVDLILATVPDVPVPTTACFFRDSTKDTTGAFDTGQFTCWLHHLTVYKDIGAPVGV